MLVTYLYVYIYINAERIHTVRMERLCERRTDSRACSRDVLCDDVPVRYILLTLGSFNDTNVRKLLPLLLSNLSCDM